MVNIVDKMITYSNSFVGAISLNRNCYNNYYYYYYYYYYSYYYYYYYYCYYYDYDSTTYIYDLNCTGVESNIWDCPYDGSYHYCNRYQDAAVICQSKNTLIYHTLAIYTNSLSRY